jgi:flagellar hook-length control protein FliK
LREKSRQQDTGQPLASAFASFAGQNQNPVIEEAAEAAAGAPIESIQRVADEVVVLCAGGAQEVQIEVDSKVLQDLRIAVRQKDGEVSVRLMTDSSQTMQALQAGLPQLMAALQARNVVVAAIDVTPRFASTGSAFSRGQRQGQSGRDRQGGRGRR